MLALLNVVALIDTDCIHPEISNLFLGVPERPQSFKEVLGNWELEAVAYDKFFTLTISSGVGKSVISDQRFHFVGGRVQAKAFEFGMQDVCGVKAAHQRRVGHTVIAMKTHDSGLIWLDRTMYLSRCRHTVQYCLFSTLQCLNMPKARYNKTYTIVLIRARCTCSDGYFSVGVRMLEEKGKKLGKAARELDPTE